MKNIVKIVAVAVILAFIAACGGSNSSTSDTPSFTSMSSLPKATSPMETTSATTSLSKQMNLFAVDADHALPSFTNASSRGACETYNQVKQGIISAGQADMIQCYVQYMDAQNKFTTDASGSAINIYDGEYQVFNLDITGADDNTPEKVKMKLTKGSNGSIDYFEMFMCNDIGGTLTQTEYTKQVIAGTSMTMRAIGNYSSSGSTGWHSVDVTGTLNASGQYVSKSIEVNNTFTDSGGTNKNWQNGTLIQTPSAFSFSGYQSGSWGQDSNTGTYQNSAYALGQMLNDTLENVKNLAMGTGAVQFISTNEMGDQVFSDNGVDAWNIDYAPVTPATDSAYYAVANAGTPVTADPEFTMAFAADETWDCSDTGTDLASVADTDIVAACTDYTFDQDGWINCYTEIEVSDISGNYDLTSAGGACAVSAGDTVTLSGGATTYTGISTIDRDFITFNYSSGSTCTGAQLIGAGGTVSCGTCTVDTTNGTVVSFSGCDNSCTTDVFTMTKQ